MIQVKYINARIETPRETILLYILATSQETQTTTIVFCLQVLMHHLSRFFSREENSIFER